jgi:hypothetical protein
MTISGILWFLLAATSASPAAPNDSKSVDAMMCGPATEIFLPDPQRKVASNVRLEHLQFMSPEDPCGRNFNHDDLTQLHEQLKAIAASSFSTSNSSFGVMVQYTLTSGGPANFEMRTMDAPDTEKANLTNFYKGAKAIKGFLPSSGTVYVAIQYSISPAPSTGGGG